MEKSNFWIFINNNIDTISAVVKIVLYAIIASIVRILFYVPKTFNDKAIMYFGGVIMGSVAGVICYDFKLSSGLTSVITSLSAMVWREIFSFSLEVAKNPLKFYNDYKGLKQEVSGDTKEVDKTENPKI
jgi:hypothetical protein